MIKREIREISLLILMIILLLVSCGEDDKAPKTANIQIGKLQMHQSSNVAKTQSDNIEKSKDAKIKEIDSTIAPPSRAVELKTPKKAKIKSKTRQAQSSSSVAKTRIDKSKDAKKKEVDFTIAVSKAKEPQAPKTADIQPEAQQAQPSTIVAETQTDNVDKSTDAKAKEDVSALASAKTDEPQPTKPVDIHIGALQTHPSLSDAEKPSDNVDKSGDAKAKEEVPLIIAPSQVEEPQSPKPAEIPSEVLPAPPSVIIAETPTDNVDKSTDAKVEEVVSPTAYGGAVELKAPKSANIQIGALQIHPSLGIGGTYSDNIYKSYDAREREHDFITTISPAISFLLPLRRHNIQLGYKAEIYKYSDFSENDYANHKVTGSLNFDFPGGLLFSISDTFGDMTIPRKWQEQTTANPRRGLFGFFTGGNQQTAINGASDFYREKNYQTNDFNVKAKYSFVDRWAIEARYNNLLDDYKEDYDKLSDFDRNAVGGSIYFGFTPKTKILIDYDFSYVEYDHDDINDNYNHMAYIGLSFDPTAKIRGHAKFGWDMKKYRNSYVLRNDDTENIFSTNVDLSYLATDFDKISVSAVRVIKEDPDTYRAYTDTNVTLDWKHVFGFNEKISMSMFVGYGNYDYNDVDTDVDATVKERSDNIWKAGIGFNYNIQPWLELSMNYGYRNDDSNFKRYDYDENLVFGSMTLKF